MRRKIKERKRVMDLKNRVGIAVIALLLTASLWGIKEIYAIAEYIENSTNVFYGDAEIDYANVKYNEKQKNKAENAARSVLDSGIKLKVSDVSSDGRTMVCYSRNIYMELDSVSLRPVFVFYECDAKEKRYSDVELESIARAFSLRNLPRSVKGHNSVMEKIGEEGGIVSYRSLFGDKESYISLRSDTGSVVFYDAYGLFER